KNLKRVLADEQNDVLQVLRGRPPVLSLAAIVPDSEEHNRRYADAISQELLQAAQAGAASVVDTDDQRPGVTEASTFAAAIDAIAVSIVEPLRDRLDRAIGVADGDNDELASLTRTVYREWKTIRIDAQLDHVVRLAFGHGALAALRAGTRVCWAVDPNGPACPDAEDNALAGAVRAGEPFPTEHTCAPAHEGCRCMLLPVGR
ncbi:MAG: hypothetical protein HY826_08350, partial [Actinobacteria bacterium]|nr:hypothetical protein [Actinomycetota bacterium]